MTVSSQAVQTLNVPVLPLLGAAMPSSDGCVVIVGPG